MSGKTKSLGHYYWDMSERKLDWVQNEQSCNARGIGQGVWKNGPDVNIAYHFTISGKEIHIHYKPGSRKIYKIHEKKPNDQDDNIANLFGNMQPLSPSDLKNLLKQNANYPNHVKLFEFVIGTYDSNNTQNNHNLQRLGELDLDEADLN